MLVYVQLFPSHPFRSLYGPACTSKGDLGAYLDGDPWLEKQCTRHSQVHACTTLVCKVWSPHSEKPLELLCASVSAALNY